VLHKLRRNHDLYRDRRRGSVVFVTIRRLLTMGPENLQGGYGRRTTQAGSPERKPLPTIRTFCSFCSKAFRISQSPTILCNRVRVNPARWVQCEWINICRQGSKRKCPLLAQSRHSCELVNAQVLVVCGESALPSKADMCGAQAHVRFGSKADIMAYVVSLVTTLDRLLARPSVIEAFRSVREYRQAPKDLEPLGLRK